PGGVDGRHRRIVQHATTAELPDSERFLVLARDTPEALLRALDEGSDEIGAGACRLALVNPTPDRAALLRSIVARGKPRRGRDGIWFSPRGLTLDGGSIAFLFPGIDAVSR